MIGTFGRVVVKGVSQGQKQVLLTVDEDLKETLAVDQEDLNIGVFESLLQRARDSIASGAIKNGEWRNV